MTTIKKEQTFTELTLEHKECRLSDLKSLFTANQHGIEETPSQEFKDYDEEHTCIICDRESYDCNEEEICFDCAQILYALGLFHEYALEFAYVPPYTFKEQAQAYYRFLISYGGPSEEFRFYVNPDLSCHAVEFWFLDWGQGEGSMCRGTDKDFMMEIFSYFADCGTVEHLFNEGSQL